MKLGFLKTVQPNSFSKLISAVCNFKNNAQETYLFVSNFCLCHLQVISKLLTLNFIAIELDCSLRSKRFHLVSEQRKT